MSNPAVVVWLSTSPAPTKSRACQRAPRHVSFSLRLSNTRCRISLYLFGGGGALVLVLTPVFHVCWQCVEQEQVVPRREG